MEKTKMNLGKVAFTLRGLYNENERYEKLDVIYHNGNSYVVVTPFSGVEPSAENEHVMLIAAQGSKGEPFTFEELTEAQKLELKGEPGNGFVIRGYYQTLLELEAIVTEPQPGDAYGVGEEHPYEIYVFDAVNGVWRNYGTLEGPQGPQGADGRDGADGKSAYEIAVELGFEGTAEEWIRQQVINGENPEEITLQAPAITLNSTEDLHLQAGGKVLYQNEEIAVKSDLADLVTNESLQEKIDQLGAVTYIALITDDYEELETLENLRPGAIALVKEEEPVDQNRYKEYIWMNEADEWEFLGHVEAQNIDLDNYYDKKEIDSKLSGKVSLTGDETIDGLKLFSSNIGIGRKTDARDGKTGILFQKSGGIEISHESTPYIDFHYENSTEDYTSRIVEAKEGVLNFTAKNGLTWNSKQLATVEQTPQFGTYQTIGMGAMIQLSSIYDLRQNYSSASGSNPVTMPGFSGGVNGMEYRITFYNSGTGTTAINLPTGDAYQSDDTTWTIEAGKVGVLGILYVFGKYIMTVVQ